LRRLIRLLYRSRRPLGDFDLKDPFGSPSLPGGSFLFWSHMTLHLSPIELLARRALYAEGRFSLTIAPAAHQQGVPKSLRRHTVDLIAKMKLPGHKTLRVLSHIDADDADIEVTTTLLALLRQTDSDLHLDAPSIPDAETTADATPTRIFLESLTPTQRLRAQVICRMWHDFKTETMNGVNVQVLEPFLQSPRSSLGALVGSEVVDL
jgi:hypothetical protein